MEYAEWTRKYGTCILERGASTAALIAMVPDAYAARYNAERKARDSMSRAMGGTSRFNTGIT